MKKQKTTKKGISKAKAAKKAESRLEKKELIRALSGKPSKQKKKTPAKKTTAKKTVAKAAPKKPIKKAAVKEAPKKVVAKKPTPEKVVSPPLPVGYGENKLASMPVTPRQVYAYWEITEDTISRYPGSLNLKVINAKTNAFFYTPISEQIGEQFISVSPAAEYTVEIGVINYKGEFVRILKSLPVEAPVVGIAPAEVKEEAPQAGVLPEEFFEVPESISSY
jgi:hypothetical protein